MAETGLQLVKEDVPSDYGWVPGKIGTNDRAILEHVLRQVRALDLEESDGCVDVIRKSVCSQVYDAAIRGGFSGITDGNMPIAAPSTDLSLGVNSAAEHDRWRQDKAKAAGPLIDRGMDLLKQVGFNDFWDGRVWESLTLNKSQSLLLDDGIALLEVVLGDAEKPEQEVLIAQVLARRFPDDIVKAEIAGHCRSASMPRTISEETRKKLIELGSILMPCPGTIPLISVSWVEVLMEKVMQGDDALLYDLSRLHPLRGHPPYEAMALILAKHFPSTVIRNLTRAPREDAADASAPFHQSAVLLT